VKGDFSAAATNSRRTRMISWSEALPNPLPRSSRPGRVLDSLLRYSE